MMILAAWTTAWESRCRCCRWADGHAHGHGVPGVEIELSHKLLNLILHGSSHTRTDPQICIGVRDNLIGRAPSESYLRGDLFDIFRHRHLSGAAKRGSSGVVAVPSNIWSGTSVSFLLLLLLT